MKKTMLKGLSFIIVLAMCLAFIPMTASAQTPYDEAANKLFDLGLFYGVGTNADGTPDFDLDRAPTRHEAVTMLVRLLGQEQEATQAHWETPFTDVASWAEPYVGYAYANGLTAGTSDTTFSGNDAITATQYLTFVLRALGYVSGEDFAWDSAWELSDELGFTAGQYNETTAVFLRSDVASISFDALSAIMKEHEVPLYIELIYNYVITVSDAIDAGLIPDFIDGEDTGESGTDGENNRPQIGGDEEPDAENDPNGESAEPEPDDNQAPTGPKTAYDTIARSYEWYFDQLIGGDCGPTAAVMAAKWVDSSFSRTAQEVRREITPGYSTTEWWYTSDIESFFIKYGIDHSIRKGVTSESLKAQLDNGNIILLCMDTSFITRNYDSTSHFGRFYDFAGGHFLIVKGYMTGSDGKLYFEVYDPNSFGDTYSDGTLKGKDRYYLASELVSSAVNWWDYYFIVNNPVSFTPSSHNPNSNILYLPQVELAA